VGPDMKMAFKLYHEASDLGNSHAKNNLATYYKNSDTKKARDIRIS
jgi:TPR repeat protein